MFEELKNHIEKITGTGCTDFNELIPFFEQLTVPKKHMLLAEGKICDRSYFVAKGCLRMFFVNEKGIEQTIQFALENWWLADYNSLSTHTPSLFNIQTVEKSEILSLDFASQEAMLKAFPKMERYFRLIHQRAHAAAQYRIKNLFDISREELYHRFIKRYPEFVQRIPQYLLASYLGFTPEYLSELRRKKIS